jgi:hypothetical protein
MRRWIAVLWHASFLVLAGVLYFFFVLPRWFELIGAWPVGLGLAMRIVTGALIGLAALPVVFTLLRTRKPEFGTPQLALSLRFWSIVLHVLAGALIVGAAVSEIWVSLDRAGQVLFGIYGAAAAVAILGALAFYLAFAAELPPPAPKPLKPRKKTRRRGRGADADEAADVNEAAQDADTTEAAEAEPSDAGTEDAEQDATQDEVPAPVTADESAPTTETTEPVETEETHEVSGNGTGNAENPGADERGSTLRNRRPSGKSTSRLFGRSRRGVALDD